MNQIRRLFMIMYILTVTTLLSAQPNSITLQGVLTDNAGTALNGTYALMMSLYDSQTKTTTVWQATLNEVTVSGGIFSVVIDFEETKVFENNAALWLGVKVEAEDEFPLTKIHSVGYALHAKIADKVANISDNDIAEWKTAYGWGDHSAAGYMSGIHAAAAVTGTKIANWDTAQEVTVTGQDDEVEIDVLYTIITAPAVSIDPDYNGLDAADVEAVNLDDDAPPPSGEVSVVDIAYQPTGPKGKDLLLICDVADDLGDPVAGASVSIAIAIGGSEYGNLTDATGEDGVVTFKLRNAPSGDYIVTVTGVAADGLTWDTEPCETTFTR